MLHTHQPGAGFRRHDAAFLAVEQVAKRFAGLPPETSPGKILAAFKSAARPMHIPRTLRLLIDQLFARTRAQDWEPGRQPIVWPKNETLADDLDLSVRQLQNLLRQALDLGLIAQKDSPNGHRGGKRGPDGHIVWAYGIDLRPIGTRLPEFLQVAAQAVIEREERDSLRRQLTIARKSIAQIAQTALDLGLPGANWIEEVETARMAAMHARSISDRDAQRIVVEQLDSRRARLVAIYDQAISQTPPSSTGDNRHLVVNSSPMDVADCARYTTTNQLQSSKEHTYLAQRKTDSGVQTPLPPGQDAETSVDRNLEKYGIDVAFIADACREVCWELSFGTPTWADVFAIAMREAKNLFVPDHAWNEACRIMGKHGAAAAMITIAHKADAGKVERPGAYLRGMSARAAIGELQLGRSFHGFREARTPKAKPVN